MTAGGFRRMLQLTLLCNSQCHLLWQFHLYLLLLLLTATSTNETARTGDVDMHNIVSCSIRLNMYKLLLSLPLWLQNTATLAQLAKRFCFVHWLTVMLVLLLLQARAVLRLR
jgi:hypothetical protein